MFKEIKSFYFNYNNIYSLYQLLKLENFENLEVIYITNNEICNSDKFVKLFLIYRIGKIKVYNDEIINFEDKILSNKIFSIFDHIILIKENQIKNQKLNNNITDKEDNNDNNIKEKKDLCEDSEDKFMMWNFVKQNLSSVLYNIISEEEN